MKTENVSLKRLIEAVRGHKARPEEIDLVVGIGKNGFFPASMMAKKLGKQLEMVWVKFYEDKNPKPKRAFLGPRLMKKISFNPEGKRILLVDDFARSGKTIELVSGLLKEKGALEVKKLVFAGTKDYCLIKTSACVEFPWSNFKSGGVQ